MQSQYVPGQFSQRFAFILKAILYALVAVYLLNCFTPLRLHVDMLRYFAIKDCIENGCPPGSDAAKDYLPFGYTALLLILSKIGLLKSFSIVLINCAYLFGGMYIVKKMFDNSFSALIFAILLLLNWTTIKFVTHPLSEMQYVFFSMASIYFFYLFTRSKKMSFLFLAFICGAISFITRSVGIALAAALATSLLWHYKTELLILIKKNKVIVAILGVIVIGVVIFSKQLGLNHYTSVFTKQFDEGLSFGTILEWHFTEWSEITLNTSSAKLLPHLPASLGKWIFILAGVLFFALFVYLLFVRKNKLPFIIKSYLFFYCLLMFTWPFYDPRFWVPVLPLIVAIVSQTVTIPAIKPVLARVIVYGALALYILLGIASVGYQTYTSLNKKVFAKTQANGVYRNEYETVFFGKPQSDTALRNDPVIISVIKRYNK